MNVNEPIGYGSCPRCEQTYLVALDGGLCLSCAAEKILALEAACWTARRQGPTAAGRTAGEAGKGLVRPPGTSAPWPA